MIHATNLLGRNHVQFVGTTIDETRADLEAVESFLNHRSETLLGASAFQQMAVHAITPIFSICPDIDTVDALLRQAHDWFDAIGSRDAMLVLGNTLVEAQAALDRMEASYRRQIKMNAANLEIDCLKEAIHRHATAEDAASLTLNFANQMVKLTCYGADIHTIAIVDPAVVGTIDPKIPAWTPRIVA